jgi:hypothetical protein
MHNIQANTKKYTISRIYSNLDLMKKDMIKQTEFCILEHLFLFTVNHALKHAKTCISFVLHSSIFCKLKVYPEILMKDCLCN